MIGVQDLTPVLEVLSSWISPAETLTLSGLSMGAVCEIPTGKPDWPIGSPITTGKQDFPNLNFSRQKRANHWVGDGVEVSGSKFQPDWPIGSRIMGGKQDFPNLNFPAKIEPTIGWGMG